MGYKYLLTAALVTCVFQPCLFAQDDSAKVKALDEVVVTGQYRPQSLKNSVYRVRTIKQEQIKLRGATDIAGVLNNELGIRFNTDYALAESDVSIMGMDGRNVKILLDGIPVVDREATKQSLSQIDINSIERIEIVEGPMSVAYGTDALAGVINIITKKPGKRGDNLSVSARIQEETTGKYYQPFANEGIHNENLALNWQNQKWYASAYGTRNTFGGWSGNAAFHAKDSKPKDQYLTGGALGFRKDDLNVWYRLDYLNEDITANGALNPNNYRSKDQDFITNRFTHQLQAEWRLSSTLGLNAAASYQDYKRETETYEYDYNKNIETPTTDPGEWDISKFKTAFFRGTANWGISSMVTLQPGIEVKSDKASGQRIAGNPSIEDYAFFVSAEIKPVAGINIRPGVRVSKNSVYDAPVVPSINVKFALSKDIDFRVSYGRGFRAPSLRELYFYFFDVNHSIQGNTDLKAEYSNSFNGSLTWQSVAAKNISLTSTLAGFYNDFNNRIDLAQIGNTLVFTYSNISKYKTTGATLDNKLSVKNLSATLGISYIGRYNNYIDDPSFKSTTQDKFNWSPEVNSNIIYRFPKLKAQAGVFYKFTGKLPRYQVMTNSTNGQQGLVLTETESFNMADLTLSKTLFKYFTIQAGVKNLFDVTRLQSSVADGGSAHGGSGSSSLVAYGRSYFAGLLINWSRN
jgi:outer membrane receptor for ferrienterochelin and colicins